MALYSFSIKPVSRLKGGSALRLAAYQSRGKVFDERKNDIYSFINKKDLLYTNIFLPQDAPYKFFDRQILWSEAENAEKRYDARTGRMVIAALPIELNLDEQIKLVEEFVMEAFIKHGIAADVAIHDGHRRNKVQVEKGYEQDFPDNPHVHILLTDRPMDKSGFCSKKNRDWNRKEYICQWRELWEKVQNYEFERKGLNVRISHESLEAQQIDREPTIHLGRAVIEMKDRGKETNRYIKNQAIEKRNKEREEERQLEQTRRLKFMRSR